MTTREEFELEHFGITPAKVGRRYHTAAALPPSAWRRTLKGWVLFALGCVLGSLGSIVVIILWKVWV